MMKTILFCGVVAMSSGCQRSSAPKAAVDEPAFRKPSAAEVFGLRSTCAELSEKILNENIIGTALAQGQVSHYDPKSNRCYVELTVHTADLTRHNDYYFFRGLYDGQTREMLASSLSEKGVKSGFILGSSGTIGFDAASTKIDTLMADDRRQ